jgi:hypothetical protein
LLFEKLPADLLHKLDGLRAEPDFQDNTSYVEKEETVLMRLSDFFRLGWLVQLLVGNETQVTRALNRHSAAVLPAVLNRREHLLVREHLAAELDLALESRLQSIRTR